MTLELARIWCSLGGFFGYNETDDIFLMKRQQDVEFKDFKLHDILENVYPDDSEKNNLAILTKSKSVNHSHKSNRDQIPIAFCSPKWNSAAIKYDTLDKESNTLILAEKKSGIISIGHSFPMHTTTRRLCTSKQ
ncbi:hypothetical protein RF11_14503 [Thelohanellus kitauei]|uniref:Uncharacterized protein n=1 Tax=Thelohanellus kitauei TaxID=669202 RepID=A0A0C2JAF9_THEKT|nr:hypothetical protein RF11_14503 [Thelohanellus kitauei]